MNEYNNLLQLLRNCKDSSNSELEFLTSDLNNQNTILESYNINYENQAEGIFINLADQPFKIFKTKESAVKYLTEQDFSLDIIIIEQDNLEEKALAFIVDDGLSTCHPLFENILYFYKFKALLIDHKISSYNDETHQKQVLLSSKHGRLDINCKNTWIPEYHNSTNNLEALHITVISLITENSEFINFFRESYVECSKGILDNKKRLSTILLRINHIIESAKRNHELYKHNFSFEDFKSKLNQDKEKYLKDYQTNLSDFLSKIASMPVQFGVYIFLIFRFSEDFLPILITLILISSWSIFKILTVFRILENISYLQRKFNSDLLELTKSSGIQQSEIKEDTEEIIDQFKKSKNLILFYLGFIIIFTLYAVGICTHFISSL